MSSRPSRLLALRVAAKLLAWAGLGALLYVLAATILPTTPPKTAAFAIAVSDLPSGELTRLQWASRRLLVLRRTPEMIAAMQQANDALADAHSDASTQPNAAHNAFRSVDPRFFVALDYDPAFGCPLELVSPETDAPVAPWRGGFRDVCRGSWYDLGGRVYEGQPSGRNLMVPAYTVADGRIIIQE